MGGKPVVRNLYRVGSVDLIEFGYSSSSRHAVNLYKVQEPSQRTVFLQDIKESQKGKKLGESQWAIMSWECWAYWSWKWTLLPHLGFKHLALHLAAAAPTSTTPTTLPPVVVVVVVLQVSLKSLHWEGLKEELKLEELNSVWLVLLLIISSWTIKFLVR